MNGFLCSEPAAIRRAPTLAMLMLSILAAFGVDSLLRHFKVAGSGSYWGYFSAR